MKTFVLTMVMALLFVSFSKATSVIPIDSLEKRVQTIEMELKMIKQLDDDEDEEELILSNLTNSGNKKVQIIKEKKCCFSPMRNLPLSNKLLVLSPLFTLLLAFLFICVLLKRSGFSLTHALSSKKTNEQGTTEFLPSASKFIAFISILVGLILIAFFFTFYFYLLFKRIPVPSFIGLWPIVVIIGLGIVPYIVQMMFKK